MNMANVNALADIVRIPVTATVTGDRIPTPRAPHPGPHTPHPHTHPQQAKYIVTTSSDRLFNII